jgi:hypothetical protein
VLRLISVIQESLVQGHVRLVIVLARPCDLQGRLLGVERSISLGAQTAGSGAGAVEVTAESRGQERAEDDVGATEGRKRKPQEENKLEGIVEREPVDNADKALDHGEEREDDPVSQPLGIIHLRGSEEGAERVVGRNGKPGNVREELTAEIEDDKEEVERNETDDGVGLGDRSRLLEVVQSGVLGKLLVELTDILLEAVLGGRHGCDSNQENQKNVRVELV